MLHVKHIPYHFISSGDWANISNLVDRFSRTIILKLSVVIPYPLPDASQPPEYILPYFQRDSVQVEWTDYGPYGDAILHLEQMGRVPAGSLDALQVYAIFRVRHIYLTQVIGTDSSQLKMQVSAKDSSRLRILRLLATGPKRLTFLQRAVGHFTT